ncbi:MAG TPA: hypothetical protein ENK39_00360 [Epsilonproteobacteria bacterium]|nr:hypothetical protein [Campylobacterota bacterium]
MQLNDILEENSVKAISKKTNISEDNIEALISENFEYLAKAKALGFISILERDFDIDLSTLREKALAYYQEHSSEGESITIGLPVMEEKKGRSKWFLLLMLGLLAYASWYFFTQFDKKTLSTLLPFSEDKVETVAPAEVKEKQNDIHKDDALSISNALSHTQTDATGAQTDIVVASIEPNASKEISSSEAIVVETSPVVETQESISETTKPEAAVVRERETIALVPEHRLWFGMIDINTGKRDNFSISNKFDIDVKDKSWLIATSSAPFSFVNKEETQEFNDAKEHYFKVSKEGIEPLSKAEYIAQGGYRKW